MPLLCLVTLEMTRPETPPALVSRWREQRQHGDTLSPDPAWHLRAWCGQPASRDWDRLQEGKKRDGWQTISHRREFVQAHGEERKDQVELG